MKISHTNGFQAHSDEPISCEPSTQMRFAVKGTSAATLRRPSCRADGALRKRYGGEWLTQPRNRSQSFDRRTFLS